MIPALAVTININKYCMETENIHRRPLLLHMIILKFFNIKKAGTNKCTCLFYLNYNFLLSNEITDVSPIFFILLFLCFLICTVYIGICEIYPLSLLHILSFCKKINVEAREFFLTSTFIIELISAVFFAVKKLFY